MRAPIERLVRLLAPGRCAGCGRPGSDCCAACRHELAIAPATAGAGYVDDGPPARMVRTAKLGAARRVARDLVDLAIARGTLRGSGDVDLVTWVPHDPLRGPRRGAHLPRIAAGHIAERLDVPAVDLLARSHAPAQRGRSRTERLSALDGIFHVRAAAWSLLAGPRARARARTRDPTPFPRQGHCRAPLRVLLVDDVRTTGATLEAAATPLRDLGVEVRCWSLLAVERRTMREFPD